MHRPAGVADRFEGLAEIVRERVGGGDCVALTWASGNQVKGRLAGGTPVEATLSADRFGRAATS